MFKTLAFVVAMVLATIAPVLADGMSDGVVRKVDTKNARITIKHGEIVNLDMPPMSMVFTVNNPALLDGVAKGDKVRFVAIEEGGKLIVTDLQPAE